MDEPLSTEEPSLLPSLVERPGTFRPLLWLTFPVLFEHVSHLLVAYVDLWLAGNFLPGAAYIAAMTLVVYATWFVANVFSFVAVGATAMTARFVGAGDRPLANRVMNQSLVLGTLWTLILMVLALPFLKQLVGMMGLEDAAAGAAVSYLTIEILMMPAIMIDRVGIACLRGAGDTVTGFVVMLIVNAVDIVVSYMLVSGAGPAPELGWIGLPLGTAAGYVVGAVLILALLRLGRAGYRLQFRLMRPDMDLMRRLLRIGIPGGIDTILITFCHLVYLRIVLQLGNVAAAAHGVAIQIEAMGYLPGTAFSIAAATMAGQYLGARDFRRAWHSALLACVVAGVVMCSAGAVFYVAAEPLSTFFLGGRKGDVVDTAVQLLRIVSFVMLPLAVTMVLAGALRGAGDTRWPLAFTVIGLLMLRVPLAAYFAYDQLHIPWTGITLAGLGWGIVGAWYAAIVDLVIRSFLMLGRFLHGGWQWVEV